MTATIQHIKDPRIALYQCALGVAKDAMEAFTDPEDRMPADTGEFNNLKIALVAARMVLPDCEEYRSLPNLLAERDRLKAANAELLAALETVIKEEAPTYHDCTDNGESECAWCIARAALTKNKEVTKCR